MLLLLSLLLFLGTGYAIKWYLDFVESEYRITLKEYLLGAAIGCILLIPAVGYLGNKIAINQAVKYKEWWNGYEQEAVWDKTKCSRDGNCQREYSCDPYQVYIPPTYDEKGRQTGGGYYETHYHSCPYTNEEWTFTIKTSLGDYVIRDSVLPTNYEDERYRPYESNTAGIPNELKRTAGVPKFWQQAKDRLKADNPGPVTKMMEYDNFILASQSTILKKYSADIKQYKKYLPKVADSTRSYYYADKVYFVGKKPAEPNLWQKRAMKLNAALGTDLQGDLHFILVNTPNIENKDAYFNALQAYWQSKALGKNNISKNAIIVIVSTTDGQTIDWVDAATGMPEGNAGLLADIKDKLKDAPLDPTVIFGKPRIIDSDNTKAKIEHTDGLLENALWGDFKFTRTCMTCKEEGGAGYKYLKGEIKPSGGATAFIFFTEFMLGLAVWVAFVLIGHHPKYHRWNQYSRY